MPLVKRGVGKIKGTLTEKQASELVKKKKKEEERKDADKKDRKEKANENPA